MTAKGPGEAKWEVSGRLWRFAEFEFDEFSRALRRNGQPVELESKPLELLYQLLLHAGEVVTREEPLETVWPGVTVVEGSLATAVSKLRKGLEDDAPSIIVTLPRIGYRLGVPVQCQRTAAPRSPELGFAIGAVVPGREQWQFVRRMDDSGSSEVWRRVTASQVTTIAGLPPTTELADNGPATVVQSPSTLAFDSAGNLYSHSDPSFAGSPPMVRWPRLRAVRRSTLLNSCFFAILT